MSEAIYAYVWTISTEVWEYAHGWQIKPFLIAEAQKKAGTTGGEWTVHAREDLTPLFDGLAPVYRVVVEGRVSE